MIEQIMYFVLGALVAALVALLILPAVWHRAVRLTTKRVEAAVPVSLFEVEAGKDQQRAQFAITECRLNMQMQALRTTIAEQATTMERQRLRLLELERPQEPAPGPPSANHAEQGEAAASTALPEGSAQATPPETSETAAGSTGKVRAAQARLKTLEAEISEKESIIASQAARLAALHVTLETRSSEKEALETMVSRLQSEKDVLNDTLLVTRGDLEANQAALHTLERRRANDHDEAEVEANRVRLALHQLEADHELMQQALAKARATHGDLPALRNELKDLAARMAALTAQMEGSASPIPALVHAGPETAGGSSETSLAARIRTLLAQQKPPDREG
ncbi:hypothetical protein ACT6QH_08700 [Xanthobacter sp. TB0139]|uniref:hypothetical protein n=1 Tax=Xanthobacter sp. TB0139 TaxID=3459178 RepID=UPI0040399335